MMAQCMPTPNYNLSMVCHRVTYYRKPGPPISKVRGPWVVRARDRGVRGGGGGGGGERGLDSFHVDLSHACTCINKVPPPVCAHE